MAWTSVDGLRAEGVVIERGWSGVMAVEWREALPGEDLLPDLLPGLGLLGGLVRYATAPLVGYACRHISLDLTTPEGAAIRALDAVPREGRARYGSPRREHPVYKITCWEDGRTEPAAVEMDGLPHPTSFPGRRGPQPT